MLGKESSLDKKHERLLRRASRRRKKYIKRYGLEHVVSESNASLGNVAFTAILKRKLRLIFVFIAVFCVTCVINYAIYEEPAVAKLSYNYDESAVGKAPNSTRLSLNDITSEDVMYRAIEIAGLSGQITPQALARRVSISPANARNSNYISTSYNMSLNLDGTGLDIDAESMLLLIYRAYKEYFYKQYGANTSILEEKLAYDETIEYQDLAVLLNIKARQIDRYLEMRIKEGGSFYTESGGQSFQSLRKLVENVMNYRITDFTAYIGETGICRDYSLYKATMEYQKDSLKRKYNKYLYGYNLRKGIISKYDEVMSAIVLVPTYNADSEFYMSRTKIGTDYLSETADNYISSAKEIKLSIDENTTRISRLMPYVSGSYIAKAEAMITDIEEQLEYVSTTALEMDKRYTREKTKNYVSYMQENIPWKNRVDLPRAAIAGLIVALMMTGVYVMRCMYVLDVRVD